MCETVVVVLEYLTALQIRALQLLSTPGVYETKVKFWELHIRYIWHSVENQIPY